MRRSAGEGGCYARWRRAAGHRGTGDADLPELDPRTAAAVYGLAGGRFADARAYSGFLNLLAGIERPPSGASDTLVIVASVIALLLTVASLCWFAAATLVLAACRVAGADDGFRQPATTADARLR